MLGLSPKDFFEWRLQAHKWILQFDCASNNNPGVVGGGGILLNLEGIIVDKFSWGLG